MTMLHQGAHQEGFPPGRFTSGIDGSDLGRRGNAGKEAYPHSVLALEEMNKSAAPLQGA